MTETVESVLFHIPAKNIPLLFFQLQTKVYSINSGVWKYMDVSWNFDTAHVSNDKFVQFWLGISVEYKNKVV